VASSSGLTKTLPGRDNLRTGGLCRLRCRAGARATSATNATSLDTGPAAAQCKVTLEVEEAMRFATSATSRATGRAAAPMQPMAASGVVAVKVVVAAVAGAAARSGALMRAWTCPSRATTLAPTSPLVVEALTTPATSAALPTMVAGEVACERHPIEWMQPWRIGLRPP